MINILALRLLLGGRTQQTDVVASSHLYSICPQTYFTLIGSLFVVIRKIKPRKQETRRERT